MSIGTAQFSRLRVEDRPGTDILAQQHQQQQTRASSALPHGRPRVPTPSSNPDAHYYWREMKAAVKERDELKASLEADDGAAAYWRIEARKATNKLNDQCARIDGIRKAENDAVRKAITMSEQLDDYKATVKQSKRALWEVWSGLDPDNPVKQQLWQVWGVL